MSLATALAAAAPLAEADPAAIEALLDAAFGVDRRGRTAYRIRAGAEWLPDLSFALFEGARLVGSLQSWPIALDGVTPLILIGPVAVAPDRQRAGLGRQLMERLIAGVDAGVADPLVLIGDPEYYGRFFGFDAGPATGWSAPGPIEQRRLLARVPAGMALPATGMLGPRAALPSGARRS